MSMIDLRIGRHEGVIRAAGAAQCAWPRVMTERKKRRVQSVLLLLLLPTSATFDGSYISEERGRVTR